MLDEIQRLRIVGSLLAVVAERGYGATRVNHILRDAGMAAQTFSRFFTSKEDCLLAAYRLLTGQLEDGISSAWNSERAWPAKVRAAIAAALAFAAADPPAARLLAVEVKAGGSEAQALQAASVDRLAGVLREGRRHYPAAPRLNRLAESVTVAGIVSLVGERLVAGDEERLLALEPELVEVALSPVLGFAQARRFARG